MPSKAEISGGNTLRFNKVTKLAKLGQSLKNVIFGTILAKFLGACFQKWVEQTPPPSLVPLGPAALVTQI